MATATDSADPTDMTKRSLIVDEAAFEEQFLRCHICNERFDQSERSPKSLPCNHTFCLPCLKQVFDHNQQNQRRSVAWLDETFEGVLKCPECRVEIFLSRSEIEALPRDHRVIQMMDFLSTVQAKSQNVCSKHDNQPLNFFCKECLIPVCRDCTVLDHKEQQGHNIVDVSEALNESSTDFNVIEEKSKDFLGKMKGRTDSLANASKQLDLQERQLKSSIKDTFIEYRLLLEKRQEALIRILRESTQEQKQKINTRFVDICTQGSDLQKMYDKFKTARASNDIRQLFTIQQQIKERETEFTCTAEANDDEIFIGCKFNNPSELGFLSEMSGLGEVETEQNFDLKNPVPAHQLVLLDSWERPVYYGGGEDVPEVTESQEGETSASSETPSRETSSRRTSYRVGISRGGREPSRTSDSSSTLARLTRRNLQSSLLDSTGVDVEEYVQPLDSNDERQAREALASTYLMRIANRLNESAEEMAEALRQGEEPSTSSIEDDDSSPTSRHSSSTTSRGGSSSRTSRSPQSGVRVVRHPTPPTTHASSRDHGSHGYTSSRYNNN
ncbi:tripartite motif-containing protein 2-like [Mizuhopecten yessoensis]|uniref:Tripartite motif-containing protein 2 n=1 Tax=Mizuhopecten yessoensis TaxID=6573 RepID=A0A210PHM4_MIZYE|nr:tripartite motif-containing protein 2-like [Mizuhopecten yessoensis]XP_021341443.1 tripartite motif-containing protein 2-like [Mizuhopecten yessoensis]OWF35983.1 Tripartite motif-containing protein 2 [Mizuhopecten yessoensis]